MTGLWVLGIIVGLLASLGILEHFNHRRTLFRIPVRIHVNGTRGKSSVTRLIAAGLRQAGIRTCAKTTGTLARMILPDGSEYPVFRASRPNVIEQLRIVRRAAEYDAQVLVLECMAIQPYLQSLCEFKMVRATHGVLTNARADHLDVMGPSEGDVALALASTIPVKGMLFTGERRHLETFQWAASDRGTSLIAIAQEEVAGIAPEELARFSYVEHAENLALALRVCTELGVSRDVALEGMWSARPDPGVMTSSELNFFGRHMIFVNGFAANDPESSERIWNMALERYSGVDKRIAIFNCRADRPDRSKQLGEACLDWREADHYVLMGTGTYIFARAAASRGIDERKLVFAEDIRVEEIFEQLVELSGRSSLIMGMANIGGQGLDLVRYFRNRCAPQEVS